MCECLCVCVYKGGVCSRVSIVCLRRERERERESMCAGGQRELMCLRGKEWERESGREK